MDWLSGGLVFIDPIFRKQTYHRSDIHAHLGNVGILYTGRAIGRGDKTAAHGYSIFDLDSVCGAPGAGGLTFKLGFGSRDLIPDKL